MQYHRFRTFEQNFVIPTYSCVFILANAYLFQRNGGTRFGNRCLRFWFALAIVLYDFYWHTFAWLFLERVFKLVFHNVCHLRGLHAHRLELRPFGFQLFLVVQQNRSDIWHHQCRFVRFDVHFFQKIIWKFTPALGQSYYCLLTMLLRACIPQPKNLSPQ